MFNKNKYLEEQIVKLNLSLNNLDQRLLNIEKLEKHVESLEDSFNESDNETLRRLTSIEHYVSSHTEKLIKLEELILSVNRKTEALETLINKRESSLQGSYKTLTFLAGVIAGFFGIIATIITIYKHFN